MPVRHHPSSRSIRAQCGRGPGAVRAGGLTIAQTSAWRLRVVGELDVLSAPTLGARLADPAIEELDVSGISFIDAAGLTVLIAARDAGQRGQLRLVMPTAAVMRILELCGELDAFAVWT